MTQQAETRFETTRASVRKTAIEPQLEERLEQALHRAIEYLLSLQAPDGHWVAELQADTTLESDYIFLLHVMGKADKDRVAKLANYIRGKQLADGGWAIYEGGPSELNASVKAYFALKLAGVPADAPDLARARQRIHALGGLEQTNSYARFYLALAGAVGWDKVPAIPPELMLLPAWFHLNMYSLSAWTRAIVVPLTILYAHRPTWPVPAHARVDELFAKSQGRIPAFDWDKQIFTWRNFFLALDRLYKLYDRFPWKPFRRRAVAKATRWLLEHLERSDGLGAIFPAMMNSIFALRALGYPADDPLTAREMGHLERFEISEDDSIRLQPCLSPVWDTAVTMVSLQEAGLPPNHPALVKATRWLLANQVLGPGDWQVGNPDAEPGGWAFEYRNDHFPDVDDTAMVLIALQRVKYPEPARLELAIRRGLNWVLSMQNRDGGWGAFDRDNDCTILTRVPFADHNAMIDPSTADLTARVLECLGRFGWPATHLCVRKALDYLLHEQTPEGAWYGRWGVNYVYGTSGVLRALEPLELATEGHAQRAVAWLRGVQNPDGGFGESCASYEGTPPEGQAASTPSQTAWGLIGLLAAGQVDEPAVTRGIRNLLEHQTPDGTWEESAITGTGFPQVFYLRYHLYRHNFPLYALARYRNRLRGAKDYGLVRFSPREFKPHNGNGDGRK